MKLSDSLRGDMGIRNSMKMYITSILLNLFISIVYLVYCWGRDGVLNCDCIGMDIFSLFIFSVLYCLPVKFGGRD